MVKTFLQTGSMEACADIIENLVAIFLKKSQPDILTSLRDSHFGKVFSAIAATMLKERRGRRI